MENDNRYEKLIKLSQSLDSQSDPLVCRAWFVTLAKEGKDICKHGIPADNFGVAILRRLVTIDRPTAQECFELAQEPTQAPGYFSGFKFMMLGALASSARDGLLDNDWIKGRISKATEGEMGEINTHFVAGLTALHITNSRSAVGLKKSLGTIAGEDRFMAFLKDSFRLFLGDKAEAALVEFHKP